MEDSQLLHQHPVQSGCGAMHDAVTTDATTHLDASTLTHCEESPFPL